MKVIYSIMSPIRRYSVIAVFSIALVVLVYRALDMQVLNQDFFKQQGEARQLRVVSIPAHRGDIVDRNGEPFAISTPVNSIWVDPGEFLFDQTQINRLAELLDINPESIRQKTQSQQHREFVYLKRHVQPSLAAQIMSLNIKGVDIQNEYKRYYPSSEIAAHVIGFSDIDDNGQEGIELAYNDWLKGKPGKKKIIKDRLGRVIEDIERISAAQPGKPVQLSIDRRLQYLAYRSLKSAVLKHNARAGSAVILDVKNGEILAMVNQPSFNANNRNQLRPDAIRNRSVTDVFEPGSTMKPLTIAAALESGRWKPYYKVETSPGYIRVNGNIIKDVKNYGDMDVSGVIAHSSNVGVSKIALSLDEGVQWDMYQRLGLGADTGSGFPGEVSGRLSSRAFDNDFQRASLAFGYGLSVTPLQLARAYSAIAADGILYPVSLILNEEAVAGDRVMSVETAQAVRKMMLKVVAGNGTGRRAQIPNYSVAGKTGTVHKFISGGYAKDRYLSIFAGIVPASNPRFVMVVMIDEPGKGGHFGGQVAAPVFSEVMSGALRLLDIAPDEVPVKKLAIQYRNHPAKNHSGDDEA